MFLTVFDSYTLTTSVFFCLVFILLLLPFPIFPRCPITVLVCSVKIHPSSKCALSAEVMDHFSADTKLVSSFNLCSLSDIVFI